MRYGWLAYWIGVALTAVAVPYALYRYGEDYNNSPSQVTNTVGGPLTVVICIGLGVAFDFFFLILATLGAAVYATRRRRRELADAATEA